MGDKLKIYTFVPVGYHASYFFRVLTPLNTAVELGMPVEIHVDRNIEGVVPEQRIRNFCEADVILLYQPIEHGSLHNARMAKGFMPSLREQAWKYPPSFVVDTDDNLFRVDPHNPAFRSLGVCDPDTGKPIPKGYSIAEMHEGKRRVLWKDGEEGFDVKSNHERLETFRQIINMTDAVTSTTPRNADYVKENATPRRTFVQPNCMRMSDFPQLDLMPDPSQIKILWQGGQNHQGDWWPLREQLGRITSKYPQVHWIMWGVNYPWVTELIPPDRMTFERWVPYEEYKLRRVMFGEDISLAPLADTRFNQCRSAIKFYEASVAKKPAATLAQATGPYLDEIQDGETGLLFNTPEEFEAKLSELIEDETKRKTLAANAKQWVNDHRDAFKETPKLIEFYQQLRDEAPYEQPHMPESQWEAFEAQMRAQQEAQAAQPQPA